MIEPSSIWKNTLQKIKATDQTAWTSALASWAATRTTMKLSLNNVLGPVMYTFNLSVFDGLLKTSIETDQSVQAAAQIARAWEAAVLASPMLVLPGAALGAPSPATTWSVVTCLVDPPSVLLGKVKLMQGLVAASPVDDSHLSKMAEAFRVAFLTLSFSVAGINSLPIPTPLLAPFTPTQ